MLILIVYRMHYCCSNSNSGDTMTLSDSIEDAMVALNLFLNNQFTEAKSCVQPWSVQPASQQASESAIHYYDANIATIVTSLSLMLYTGSAVVV